MHKQHIEYDSPVDALVAVTKRLSSYESQYKMSSDKFAEKFNKGQLDDRIDFIEWANDFEHFQAIKHEIEQSISHA